MASAITHFIVGAAVALPAVESRRLRSVLPAWSIPVTSGLLAVVPDFDTFAARFFDAAHGSLWSHRGVVHSACFLVLFCTVLAGVAARRNWTAWVWLTALWSAAAITHPILDMLTDGGSGVMLLFPLSMERWFFPWRPIRVSPLSIARFFTRAGPVLRSEAPFDLAAVLAGGVAGLARRRRALGVVLVLGGVLHGQPAAKPTVEELLRKFPTTEKEVCPDHSPELNRAENGIFSAADDAVENGLNQAGNGAAAERAATALKRIEALSVQINSAWDKDARFRYDVLDFPPAIVVSLWFRGRSTFSFFENHRTHPSSWQQVGAIDDHKGAAVFPWESVTVYPLHRGPSGKVRFLANFQMSNDCGSGSGLTYAVYEWQSGELQQILSIEGDTTGEGPDVAAPRAGRIPDDWFGAVGEFKPEGARITLPYCWYSGVDTFHNPTLCAVETYDLSGDKIRFVSREVNRPDLLPIAKAIEYATAHDLPALQAYCATPELARRLIEGGVEQPTGTLRIHSVDSGKKQVDIGMERIAHWEVEKRGDRWLVTSYRVE